MLRSCYECEYVVALPGNKDSTVFVLLSTRFIASSHKIVVHAAYKGTAVPVFFKENILFSLLAR